MFLIASALILRNGAVLVVEQQGPEERNPSWMLPGGRVEEGEGVLTALHREVTEETGLRVTAVHVLAFVVEVVTPSGVYSALTFHCEADGEPLPADPDGFVRSACFLPSEEAIRRIAEVEWYDVAPLKRYLRGEAPSGATYTRRSN